MGISNNDLCDVLYKIRDLINQGEFDHAVAMTDTLKRDLVTAYVHDNRLRCMTTCKECKEECK